MVTLPIERMERHRGKAAIGEEGYADDRHIDPDLAKLVDQAFGNAAVHNLPFFNPGAWRYAEIPFDPGQNISRLLPPNLCEKLRAAEAVEAAGSISASQWAACLRNALAHGGIAYLNADGVQSDGEPTEMMAFVSAKYKDRDTAKPPLKLRALRIDRDGYLDFLRRWVDWLRSTMIYEALAA